jgi:hypothetical protein
MAEKRLIRSQYVSYQGIEEPRRRNAKEPALTI